jgi:hypothetical protein
MTFPGFGKGSIEQNFYRLYFGKGVMGTEGLKEALSGPPWAQCMGTGGTNAYLENVKYGYRFVWQTSEFITAQM